MIDIKEKEKNWKELTEYVWRYKERLRELEEANENARREILALEEEMMKYYEENDINPDEKFQALSESCEPRIKDL